MITKSIRDLSVSVTSGITPLRSNPVFWTNGTIPWLKTEQLGTRYIFETNEKISDTALRETSIKLNPSNTLSIAMYGEGKTRGTVSILKSAMTTNQACCNVVLDNNLADVDYVYYFLKTQYQQLRIISSGIRKNLNSNDIKDFEIRIPEDIKAQKRIAAVLSSLDAKIELNNRINAELGAMAKTLYDYWFVQFDFPDENGQPYKSSGGKMAYNKILKQKIPEGWESMKFGDRSSLTRGVTYSKNNVCASIEAKAIGILRATNITGNKVDASNLVFISNCSIAETQYLNNFETLLVMSSGSKNHIGKNGIYYFDDPSAFGAFCSKITINKDYLFYWLFP